MMSKLKRRTSEEWKADIATRLRYYRRRSGLKQWEVAEMIGYKTKIISRWEGLTDTGARPISETLDDLAWAYGITIQEFWGPMPPTKKGRG